RDMGMRAMGLTWSPLERHRRLAALIPASTLTIIEDCGHMSTLEQPDGVNAALRWWLTPSPQEARLHLGRPAPAGHGRNWRDYEAFMTEISTRTIAIIGF